MLSTVRDAALDNPTRTLAGLRLVIGVSGWVAPGLTWTLAGMGTPESESSVAATRLFAAREIALAAGGLHPDPAVRRATVTVGLAVDSLDAAAYLIAVKKGAPKRSIMSAALALSAVGLGVVAHKSL